MADLPDIEEITTGFSNGISQNSKTWLPQSARMLRGLEIFNDTDSVTLKPAPAKDSGAVVTDLVKWMVGTYPYEADGIRYALGDSGNMYRIAANVWSLEHTIGASTGPTGQGMVQLGDSLFYANASTIGRKYPLSGSGTYNDDFLSDGANNIDINVTASGQTYTPPTAISETSTNVLAFNGATTGYNLFAYDPVIVVQLYVTNKGTGNWTVTLHDNNNNVIQTSTILNASLTNGVMNSFTFANQARIYIGAKYHVHVTSTVADGTLQTSVSSDVSTAQVKTQFGILVSDTLYHPQIQFTNGVTGIVVTGNEHYLSVYDNITYNPNKITLLPGYKVRALMTINGYLVAFCWQGTTITSFEYGYAFYWDGIQPYYNFARPLTEGMPNAIFASKNRMFGIFGSNGSIEIAPDEQSPFRKIQPAPKLTQGANVEVLPGAIGVWQSRVLFGYGSSNDSNAGQYNDLSAGVHVAGDTYTPPSGLEPGIYEFGNQSDRQIVYTQVSTEVLTYSWTPSTTIVNPTSFQVGCVMPFGQDVYFSYKDGASYYVDRVNKANNASAFGSYESLIHDEDFNKIQQYKQMPSKVKLGTRIRVTFPPLPSGVTVTAKWRKNRVTPWTFGASIGVGQTEADALIGGITGRYREMEYGFDVTSTGNFPVITSCGFFFKPLTDEIGGKSL